MSSEKITQRIQRIVAEKHLTYLDAVLYLCEEQGWDPESIAPHLGDVIKAKLSEDAQRLHYIPPQPSLPF